LGAAALAALFTAAAVIWVMMASERLWTFRELDEPLRLFDVITPTCIALMIWMSFKYSRSAMRAHIMPSAPVRVMADLLGATGLAFIGFMFWTWSGTIEHYAKLGANRSLVDFGLVRHPWWLAPLERYTGLGLILVGVLLVARSARTAFVNMRAKISAAAA
jgi:hypothetical protein